MKRRVIAFFVVSAAGLWAQPKPVTAVSVSGVVRDSGTGSSLANYLISTRVASSKEEVSATTDDQGSYRLAGLPAGKYSIQTRPAERFVPPVIRMVTVADQDLKEIDFAVAVDGTVSGRVLDENKEPVTGALVSLVSREYYLGSVGHYFKSRTNTNDRGDYTLTGVLAGRPYFVMVEKPERMLAAHSDVPLNPKLRRPVVMRTWYPNSPDSESAAALTIRSGEQREGVDIRVKKSASYCIDGAVFGSSGSGELFFFIEAMHPASGTSNGGGMVSPAPHGTTERDGKFRICGLSPGMYRLAAGENWFHSNEQRPLTYILDTLPIVDRDLHDVKLAPTVGTPVQGEVEWAGEAPDKPEEALVSFWLQPLVRANFMSEQGDAKSSIPGKFSFPRVLIDDYVIRPNLRGPGLYLKDVTYDGRSVLHAPIRVGNGNLRVVVGRDGGTLQLRATDKDGNPVGNTSLLILPAEIGSEAQLEAVMISGQTDQTGQYASRTLAPGKYLVAATNDAFDYTPESIGRIWRARHRFTEITLAPKGSAQASLKVVQID